MVSLESPDTIYDNAIEYYFREYFENRNIELDGNGYKSVPMNVYQSAFRYVYKKLFKPDPNDEKRDKRKNSMIDYNNATQLDEIITIYGDIVTAYDIKATQYMFCDLTGIHRDTLNSWENSNTRAYTYKDLDGNIINNINEYVMNGKGDYIQEPSTTYCDIVKKIKSFSHITAYNGLNDTPVGQITHANNSKEAGMEYNRKREIESAIIPQMSLEDIQQEILSLGANSSVGNIAQQNNTLLDVVD